MQFTWNIAQGVSSYNKQTGFGFVIGAVYNANAALRIPETNSSFLPQWWYAGTAICDVTCTEYGVQATATDAVRAEDLECRSLPVWFRVDVPAEGVYRTKITVTGTDGGEVLVFIGRRRLVWRGTLAAGENKTITAYCDVFPIVPRGQVDAVPSTAVNVTVVGGALAAAAVAEAPDVYNDLYSDIVGHETYAGTIQCAAQNDLIPPEWVADGSLYPNQTVTAADFLAVLIPGAAGRRPLADAVPVPDSVPVYAKRAVGQAVAEGLIAPEALTKPLNRSNAAEICRRLHI